MRSLVFLTAAAVAAATLTATAHARADQGVAKSTSVAQQVHSLRSGIAWHRSMTWRYQDRAGVPRTHSAFAERHTRSVPFLRWIDRRWNLRQIRAKRLTPRVPHLALWMCIHHGEAGDWQNEDTGGNGHYGGLQMHWSWGYGIVGDPAHYSEAQQLAAAERGYRASGYSRSWLLGQWYHPECLGYA